MLADCVNFSVLLCLYKNSISIFDLTMLFFSLCFYLSVSLSFQSSNVVQDVSNPHFLEEIDGWQF